MHLPAVPLGLDRGHNAVRHLLRGELAGRQQRLVADVVGDAVAELDGAVADGDTAGVLAGALADAVGAGAGAVAGSSAAEQAGRTMILVIPVRAGGEWLGSIWAVVEDRPPASTAAALAQTASVVALHLLRLRAQADLPRLVAADRLRSALSGHTEGVQDWLPAGPVAGRRPGRTRRPGRPLELWESVCRRHGWRQPLLSDLDCREYAVLRDVDTLDPGTWAWLTSVVLPASDDSLGLTARAGRAVKDPGELPDSRSQAQETDRVVASSARAATYEERWAEVTLARAAASLAGELLGPLALLNRHDEKQHTDYLPTLAAFLDYSGAPTRAARSINLHRNTLRYRMNHIVGITGLDLKDPAVRLALRLQLVAVSARPLPP